MQMYKVSCVLWCEEKGRERKWNLLSFHCKSAETNEHLKTTIISKPDKIPQNYKAVV
jgi:hypothetical protein